MIEKKDFTFLSSDGETYIHAVKWTDKTQSAKAILQLVHGMTEHIDRYDDFARFLAQRGITVVGHDHLGHGTSVKTKEDWGYFSEENPDLVLIEDIHCLRLLMLEEQKTAETRDPVKYNKGKLPYFILGHSMGSYLLREYLGVYDEELSGAIIMGTGYESAKTTAGACRLLSFIKFFRGSRHRSNFIKKMTMKGPYKKFDLKGHDLTKSWLTRNPKAVDQYMNDPRCTFTFTLNGYKGLFNAVDYSCRQENTDKIRKDIPIFLVSGSDDPVGNLGIGVKKVHSMMKKAGINDVSVNLYQDYRHEILNEINNDKVYKDILNWMLYRL